MAEKTRHLTDLSRDKLRSLISRLKEKSRAEDAPIEPRPAGDGPLPLSFAQERLWFLDRLGEGSAPYAIPGAVRLAGRVDPAVLRRTFAELARRHESLRTTFGQSGGIPFQSIAPASQAESRTPLPVVDLAALPGPAAEAEVLRLAGGEARRPFDLMRGPLFRTLLARLGPEDHVLSMTMHHIVSDGWSMTVFIREMAALYEAFAAGRPSPLPEPRLQYADFALWQRERLRGERLESQISWWRDRLAGLPPLELPTDRPRPPVQTYNGARRRLSLSAATAGALQELGRREGATPFMVLLALWDTLLCRYSRQTDLGVGSPVANRGRSEIEGLIGFFVNTLVLRADLSGHPSFRELLGRVRETTLEAYAHDELPFEKLVEHLQPERLRDRNPLFQAMCTLQNQPWPELRVGDLRLSPLELDNRVAKFDLTLTWIEAEGGLQGGLEYNTDLFDGATAQRLLRHYLALVRAALADPGQAVGDLPLLGDEEWRQILVDWNRTATAYPREATIPELFAAQALAAPEAPAVELGPETVTYLELARRAALLAGRLRSLGVVPEARVGLCLERSPDLVAAMLATLQAGGAYVPLDPSYPRERLAWMLEDAGVAALVAHEALLDSLPEDLRGVPVVRMGRGEMAEAEAAPAGGVGSPGLPSADSLAYVMYTSGSTGRAKGVAVTHRAIVRLAVGTDYVEPRPDDRFAHLSNTAFDASTFEVWTPLLHGGCVVALERDAVLSPQRLAAELRERRIDTTFLTTALFQQVVREVPDAFATLRDVLFGGETCDPARVRQALQAGPRRLLHVYGPTEGTTFTTWQLVREVPEGAAAVPIGRPLANSRVFLLDPELWPVPPGVPGELYIGGDGIARGYFGRPDLTAERFVPDPCSGELGGRLYRTGDLARFLPGGAVDFLGRVDEQVKMRGFRIEPGEIEAALREHPAVAGCAVLIRQDTRQDHRQSHRQDRPGDRYLAAYVTPAGLSAQELRSFLAGKLPAHMLPATFVGLAELPLNPNGKVDRRALARMEPPTGEARARAAQGHVPPRTTTELRLAGIWAELLGLERVGALDNFFELGGHSLMAVQAISRLRDLFDVELPLRALFDEPTVAGLAARVDAARRSEAPAGIPPLAPVPRGAEAPPSFAQERLWFLDQLEPGTAFYNIPSASHLRGPLRVGVLRRCLDEMVRRHESLRTTFEARKGQPFQVVSPAGPAESPLIDLSALPEPRREDELHRRAAEEARRPFDLARGPLFRAPLFRLGPDEHVLVSNTHHIVSDGWSTTVINREMAALYEAFAAGRPSPLPEPYIQYADFAIWQRGYLQGEVLAAKMAYWRERLAGAPGLQLPADRPRPAVKTYRGGHSPVALSPGLTRALQDLAFREGVTLYMALLAAFQTLLLRYSGQADLPVGSPIANRYRSELEGVIGFFANTVVLRTDLSGDPTFRELLGRVREVTLGAYAHEDVPFEKIVEEIQPERDRSHDSLFQVMCVLQNQPWPEARMGDVAISGLPVGSGTAKFDLSVFWREHQGALDGVVEHNSDLFDGSTVLRLCRHYEALLRAAAEEPGRRLAALPLLADAERHQILLEWAAGGDLGNGLAGDGACLHELFEAQARRTPEALALVAGAERLTYRELDARAGRLAGRLRALGAGPERPVGVCLDRSADLVVALLAVLESGSAYVPLDPAYPPERLAFLAADARLVALVTMPRLLAALPALGWNGPTLLATDAAGGPEGEGTGRPEGERTGGGALPEGLAYLIYTSGSTGVPKGVAIEHRSAVALVRWARDVFPQSDLAGVLASTSIAFDLSVFELFVPLSCGGAVILVENALALPAGVEAARAAGAGITLVNTVPSAIAELVRLESLPGTVRTVNLAGEPLKRPLVDRVYGWPGVEQVLNLYGPSEDTTYSTFARVPSGVPQAPTIGRPIAGTRAYVLDPGQRPAPIGVVGELYLGGRGLARCYLGRPELTAERFVPDPFGPPGGRLYRTGDLARHLADGQIAYQGRIDTQVKIRGFRIEPGEIETALALHPEVRDAAVVARAGGGAGQRLVAYVVPVQPGGSTLQELRAYLKRKLPEHMVPAAFVEIPALPLNANGKLDQAALPEPDPRADSRAAYVAPRTPVEEELAAFFSSLLGVEEVGVHDDFFDLGGHSLLGTRLMAQVHDSFGVDLKVRTLFEAPTVAELAAAVTRELLERTDEDALEAALAEMEEEDVFMRAGDG